MNEREQLIRYWQRQSAMTAAAGMDDPWVDRTIAALQGEPVAWITELDVVNLKEEGCCVAGTQSKDRVVPLAFAAPQPYVQGRGVPVAWRVDDTLTLREDWAKTFNWLGATVGTGRAIPDSWKPVLYLSAPQPLQGWVNGRVLLVEAIARGWCSPKNSHKEMDGDLVEAIADEIAAAQDK